MFSKPAAGGGVGLTSGIHLLDHIAWITGQPLTLDCARFGYSQCLGDVEDLAAFSLHAAGGAPVQILLGWKFQDDSLRGELTIFGTKGTLSVQGWQGRRLTNAAGARCKACFDQHLTIRDRACEAMKNALSEFAATVHENREPVPSAENSGQPVPHRAGIC
jgi:predicted dehydrogenase